MNIFNNREIATAIWLVVLFIFMLAKKEIRKSLLDVIKAFFKIKILIPVILMIIYIFGTLLVLYQINLWDISLLKDLIIWFIFTGLVLVFNSITSKKEESFFRKYIIDNIKIVIIIEFIINTYTFSLMGELFFIPFMTIIAMLDVVAKSDIKYLSVSNLLKGVQIIIGILILVYALFNAISDYNNLGSFGTIKDFLLAPLLTLIFLPFVYITVLISKYELLFIRMEFGSKKSKKLQKYMKRKIIWYCLLSLEKTNAVSNNLYKLMDIESNEDLDIIIKTWKHEGN